VCGLAGGEGLLLCGFLDNNDRAKYTVLFGYYLYFQGLNIIDLECFDG
jgi:hypothetical protein